MTLKCRQLHPDAKLPTRAKELDSGWDLYAVEDTVLLQGVPTLIRSGLAVEPPKGGEFWITEHGDTGQSVRSAQLVRVTIELQLRARSGLALKHAMGLANGIGTIDNGYRSEVQAIVVWGGHNPNYEAAVNADGSGHDHSPVLIIRKGERFAQLVPAFVPLMQAQWTEELSNSERGTGGFGSTGK